MGYTNVGHYPEGKKGWMEAGLPVEKGYLGWLLLCHWGDSAINERLAFAPTDRIRQDEDFVFASPTLKGKQPLWGQTMNAQFVKPAGIELGLVAEGEHSGWHRFRHSLSTWANDTTKDITVSQDDASSRKGRHDGYTRMETSERRWKPSAYGAVAEDEARFGVNPMSASGWHRAGILTAGKQQPLASSMPSDRWNGGRYRI